MKQASGLLVYRKREDKVEVFLTHPGGPFWARKDEWSIPKGEVDDGETLMETLKREFIEEVGVEPPLDEVFDLGTAKASGDKMNYIWAAEGDIDLADFHCDSMVTMSWPPRSDKLVTFPENDRAEWFEINRAYSKIFKSQMVFIERLARKLDVPLSSVDTPTDSTLF
jgi:predicted NUDIX family NTP pyrophosphohydrolase